MVNTIKGFGNVNKHDISKAIHAIYGLTNHLEILIYTRAYFEQNLSNAPSLDFPMVKPNCLGLKTL